MYIWRFITCAGRELKHVYSGAAGIWAEGPRVAPNIKGPDRRERADAGLRGRLAPGCFPWPASMSSHGCTTAGGAFNMAPGPAEQQETWRSNLIPASCPIPPHRAPRVGRESLFYIQNSPSLRKELMETPTSPLMHRSPDGANADVKRRWLHNPENRLRSIVSQAGVLRNVRRHRCFNAAQLIFSLWAETNPNSPRRSCEG